VRAKHVDMIPNDWLRISSLVSVGRTGIMWRYLVASLLASFVFEGIMMVPFELDALVSSIWLLCFSQNHNFMCGGELSFKASYKSWRKYQTLFRHTWLFQIFQTEILGKIEGSVCYPSKTLDYGKATNLLTEMYLGSTRSQFFFSSLHSTS